MTSATKVSAAYEGEARSTRPVVPVAVTAKVDPRPPSKNPRRETGNEFMSSVTMEKSTSDEAHFVEDDDLLRRESP